MSISELTLEQMDEAMAKLGDLDVPVFGCHTGRELLARCSAEAPASWVLMAESDVAGLFAVRTSPRFTDAYQTSVYVRPEWRGRGVATAVNIAAAVAAHSERLALFASVSSTNAASIAAHQRVFTQYIPTRVPGLYDPDDEMLLYELSDIGAGLASAGEQILVNGFRQGLKFVAGQLSRARIV